LPSVGSPMWAALMAIRARIDRHKCQAGNCITPRPDSVRLARGRLRQERRPGRGQRR
jgi:hypothetical protein